MRTCAPPKRLSSAVRGCDVVYHLAGKTSALTRRELYRTNVDRQLPPSPKPAPRKRIRRRWSSSRRWRPRARPLRADCVRDLGWGSPSRSTAAANEPANWPPPAGPTYLPVSIVRPAIVFGPRNREMLPMFRSITRYLVHPVPGFVDAPRRADSQRRSGRCSCCESPSAWRSGCPAMHMSTDRSVRRHVRKGIYFAAAPEIPDLHRVGSHDRHRRPVRQRVMVLSDRRTFRLAGCRGQPRVTTRLRRQSSSFNSTRCARPSPATGPARTRRVGARTWASDPRGHCSNGLDETVEWYRRQGWI